RSTAHDLERYAGLFAQRTKVMKSSAMRDLMALTERAEVISLAGGLPDTSTFPADTYASLMATVAEEACARALQYGPTEGFAVDGARPRALRGSVRAAHEGHEVLRDARPDGADRARRGDLARRRAARHVDVPGRHLRVADGDGGRGGLRESAAVRADRGLRGRRRTTSSATRVCSRSARRS